MGIAFSEACLLKGIWEVLGIWFACFLKLEFEFFLCVCVVKKFFTYSWCSLLEAEEFQSVSVCYVDKFQEGERWKFLSPVKGVCHWAALGVPSSISM